MWRPIVEKNEVPEGPKPELNGHRPDPDSDAESLHVITAKDAGWLTPTVFVAPATFVAIDPSESRKRKRGKSSEDNHGGE